MLVETSAFVSKFRSKIGLYFTVVLILEQYISYRLPHVCHTQVLLAACEDQNVDGFAEAVRDYDSISRLDGWYTTMMLRIKKAIDGEPDLR